jgi:hypothetical protein
VRALPRLNIPLSQPNNPSHSTTAHPCSLQLSQQHYRTVFTRLFPSMQTPPMQPFFAPQPPLIMAHRPHAIGIQPQTGLPIAPVAQIHVRHPSVAGAPVFGQHIPPPRCRRQLSIGGPPKAILSGPGRKLSPLPTTATTSPAASASSKKVTANLPKETISGDRHLCPLAQMMVPHSRVR